VRLRRSACCRIDFDNLDCRKPAAHDANELIVFEIRQGRVQEKDLPTPCLESAERIGTPDRSLHRRMRMTQLLNVLLTPCPVRARHQDTAADYI
jgi:hypothetical protein